MVMAVAVMLAGLARSGVREQWNAYYKSTICGAKKATLTTSTTTTTIHVTPNKIYPSPLALA